MPKETRPYWKMREAQEIQVIRRERGRYTIQRGKETWIVWRGVDSRWYGQCKDLPGKMISAGRLVTAKYDLRMGLFVDCASAGV